jgi:GNAT superfamily N-acetyltransferase
VADLRNSPFTVSMLAPSRYSEAEACLARAFWPDPLFGFFMPDRRKEYSLLPDVFHAFLADAGPFERTWAATIGGESGGGESGGAPDRVVGAAVWVPPGGMPRPFRRELMMQLRLGRLLLKGSNLSIGLKLLTAVDKVHPSEPHWYLALLGSDPAVQGRGVGSALLAPAMAQADAEGVSCYLETQKEENLPFYGRHGFEVLHVVSVPGSPTVWGMRRPPRS